MVQKTVRFYQDVSTDASALNKLSEYRRYGFTSAREMIITAINAYGSEGMPEPGRVDADELAEKIVSRIEQKWSITSNEADIIEKPSRESRESHHDKYQKALSFIESL